MTNMSIPFNVRNGRIARTSNPSEIAAYKIVNVLTVNKGERVAIPNYGAGTSFFLFQNVDDLELADFRVDAIQELNGRISKAEILNVSIEPDTVSGENYVKVTVAYRLPLSNPQIVSFRIAIPGELLEDSPF